MSTPCFLEKYFSSISRVGASVTIKVSRMPIFLIILIYFSFLSTLVANLVSLKVDRKGTRYSHFCEVFLDTTIIFSILSQVTLTKINGENLVLLVKRLLEPLKKYPRYTRQFKIIQQYKTRISICSLAIAVFLVVGNIFHGLSPLLVIYWSSNHDAIKAWPLPIGKLPMQVYSGWFYGVFYALSLISTFISSLLYVCWFVIIVCSTFYLTTELKLLSLEVKALNVRAEQLCENRLSFLTREQRLKTPRQDLVEFYFIECLEDVVKKHVKIMRHVRLLESSYRWVILGYCKAAVLITALALMIMVDEWKAVGSISTVRINMTFSTLFFIFINSYSGQIIIDESENLRVALCGINWIQRSRRFTRNFKIVMVATQKPLRLTAGSVYTLGMESYCKTMEAVYSFVNFLIPLQR